MVKNILPVSLLGLLILMGWSPLEATGLDPLKPEQGLQGSLHTLPDSNSPKFREIAPTDRVVILRSQGEWYEVDVTSATGLEFRGWVRGGLAPERIAPVKSVESFKPAKANPLKSDRFLWFWSGEIEEKAELAFLLGTESLRYKPTGTPLGPVTRISGYNFWGLSFGGNAQLTLLETQFWNREFRWLLKGNYHYALFQVAFGNSPDLPGEIQGASYRIQTHKFEILSMAELRPFVWSGGFLRTRMGAGYLSIDDSPDLRRTNRGNVVFSQIGFSGIVSPVEFEAQFAERYRGLLSFSPVWLPSVTESPDASATNDLKTTGLHWLAKVYLQYRINHSLSVQGGAEYFSGKAKHPGESRRIDQLFEDVKIDFTSMRLVAGLGLHF